LSTKRANNKKPDVDIHPPPASAEAGPEDFTRLVDDAGGRLDELGRLFADASGRLSELDRLFGQASRPFEELETLLGNVQDSEAAALEASDRADALKQELASSREEVGSLREALTHDEAELASESKQRQEWESRAADARTQVEELQRQLQDEQRQLQEEQDRAAKLESDLARAEVRITTSAQEANAAALRAEAAKHDAEAARLEAQAARHDVEAARLEAETFQQHADSARGEAQRFREAAETAFEQMQAVRAEWAPGATMPTDEVQGEAEADSFAGPEPNGDTTASDGPDPGITGDEVDSAAEGDELDAGGLALSNGRPLEGTSRAELEGTLPVQGGALRALEPVGESPPEVQSAAESPLSADEQSDPAATEVDSLAVDAPEAEDAAEGPAERDGQPEGAPEADSTDERVEPTSVQVGTISPLGWPPSAKLALTESLAACSSGTQLLETAVDVIGTHGGWDAALAWTLDTRTLSWTPAVAWTASHDRAGRLKKMFKHLRADDGSAIAEAGFDGKINWYCEPVPQIDTSLTTLAAEDMRSFAVVPLKQEPETTVVLQLCSRHEGRPGAELRLALEAIAEEVASTYDGLGGLDGAKGRSRWRRL
jgi:hypothetical protein